MKFNTVAESTVKSALVLCFCFQLCWKLEMTNTAMSIQQRHHQLYLDHFSATSLPQWLSDTDPYLLKYARTGTSISAPTMTPSTTPSTMTTASPATRVRTLPRELFVLVKFLNHITGITDRAPHLRLRWGRFEFWPKFRYIKTSGKSLTALFVIKQYHTGDSCEVPHDAMPHPVFMVLQLWLVSGNQWAYTLSDKFYK